MKINKKVLFTFAVSTFGFMAFFQNCSKTHNFSEINSSTAEIEPVTEVSTKLELKVSHVKNNRIITVTTKNLSVSDSRCKFQYQKNGASWIDFSDEILCHTDLLDEKIYLPAESNWTNNFNTTGVSIRMIRTLDGGIIGSFDEKLTCLAMAASSVATPDVDEDCDSQWDDVVLGASSEHKVPTMAKASGTLYSCEETQVLSTKHVAQFLEHRWQYISGFYSNPECDYDPANYNISGVRSTRRSKTLTGITEAHVWAPSAGTCVMINGYNRSTQQSVTGYSYITADWDSAECVYLYYPRARFN